MSCLSFAMPAPAAPASKVENVYTSGQGKTLGLALVPEAKTPASFGRGNNSRRPGSSGSGSYDSYRPSSSGSADLHLPQFTKPPLLEVPKRATLQRWRKPSSQSPQVRRKWSSMITPRKSKGRQISKNHYFVPATGRTTSLCGFCA